MKKFLSDFFLFLIVFATINISLHFIIAEEKFWGNPEFARKVKDISGGSFNTLFFGSSRILTGINPHQFDSLTMQRAGFTSKSYNLATAGTWANETFYLFDRFLSDTTISNQATTVFIEFQNILAIQPAKLGTDKVIYYQSYDNLIFMLRYSLDKARATVRNVPSSIFYAATYSIATLEHYLNVGRLSVKEKGTDSLQYGGADDRGYLALMENEQTRNSISEHLDEYVTNISTHLTQKEVTYYNKTFYERIIKLISKSRDRGIIVIFVLPPVKLTEDMVAVFNTLPDQNKIQLCDPQEFPELFREASWADGTHLSKSGSNYLNNYLVERYVERIRMSFCPP